MAESNVIPKGTSGILIISLISPNGFVRAVFHLPYGPKSETVIDSCIKWEICENNHKYKVFLKEEFEKFISLFEPNDGSKTDLEFFKMAILSMAEMRHTGICVIVDDFSGHK